MSDNFRTVARTLQPYISDTYNLLNATDAVLVVLSLTAPSPAEDPHDARVQWVLNSPAVLALLVADRKISGIKVTRAECPGNPGLKEAKEAVEDPRVASFVSNFQKGLAGEGFCIEGHNPPF